MRPSIVILLLASLAAARAEDGVADAVKAVERLSGSVERDQGVITGVDLGHTAITDEGLKVLAPLKGLKTLSLFDTKVSDEGLKNAVLLKGLTRLDLSMTKISDDGLEHLAALPALTSLDVGLSEIRNA